jgi:hypothetical protein
MRESAAEYRFYSQEVHAMTIDQQGGRLIIWGEVHLS